MTIPQDSRPHEAVAAATPFMTPHEALVALAGSSLLLLALLCVLGWATAVALRAKAHYRKADGDNWGREPAMVVMAISGLAFFAILVIDVFFLAPRAFAW